VLATRVGGNPEILDAESGVLVPSGDPAALASALDALAASPERRSELGAGARRRVEREFSLERMIAAYAAIYRDA
jgi:glycosyltransferase involved in cell wall biosynthesis